MRSVAIDAEGSRIFTGGHEKKLRLFDLNRADADATNFITGGGSTAHEGNIKSVVWQRSHGQRSVVSAGEDKVVRWWDLRSGQVSHEMSFSDPIVSMERSFIAPLGGETLTIASGKRLLFLDLETHSIHKEFSDLPQPPPSSASLHPGKANTFITGSTSDGWVRIYDYATGQEKELHKGHHGPAHILSYSPDGELAASGSEDGTIRLWQTTPGKKYGLWV